MSASETNTTPTVPVQTSGEQYFDRLAVADASNVPEHQIPAQATGGYVEGGDNGQMETIKSTLDQVAIGELATTASTVTEIRFTQNGLDFYSDLDRTWKRLINRRESSPESEVQQVQAITASLKRSVSDSRLRQMLRLRGRELPSDTEQYIADLLHGENLDDLLPMMAAAKERYIEFKARQQPYSQALEDYIRIREFQDTQLLTRRTQQTQTPPTAQY